MRGPDHTGNPLNAGFLKESCYNLLYLELAACRLTALPEDLSQLVPNLRVLNLNYNFLEDARPLEGLTRLRKLTIIGSRLKGTKPLIRLLQRMPDVEMLDFRCVFSFLLIFLGRHLAFFHILFSATWLIKFCLNLVLICAEPCILVLCSQNEPMYTRLVSATPRQGCPRRTAALGGQWGRKRRESGSWVGRAGLQVPAGSSE